MAIAAGHQLAAHIRERVQSLGGNTPCTAKGGQLAVAVACRSIGLDAKGLCQCQRAHAHRTDGGLRDFSGLQCRLLGALRFLRECRMRINVIAEALHVRFRMLPGEDTVCLGDGFQHFGELAGQIAEHAGIL